ncbi:MAG: hypothetical protein WC242_00310 [Candidatus Paceibacterota bacterium]|jgi:hypothetical protein
MDHAKASEAIRSLVQGKPARLQLIFRKGKDSITGLRRLMVRKGEWFTYDDMTEMIILAVVQSNDWDNDENRKVVIDIPVVCWEFVNWFLQSSGIVKDLESIAVVH